MTKKKEDEKKARKKKTKRSFIIALSVESMIGFMSIMLQSLFYVDISKYIGTLWLITLGVGLILESSFEKLKRIKVEGLTPELLGELTMLIVGSMAVIAGILSLPQINIQNPSFLAVKGIISILAIILIILQTWVADVKEDKTRKTK